MQDAGCRSGVCGHTVAPPPSSYTQTQPPLVHVPPPLTGRSSHERRLLLSSLLMCGCFFSKKENFNADLRRKYVCRSAVAMVETTFLWHYFSFLLRFLVA